MPQVTSRALAKLWPSFGSSTQSPTVLWPSLVWPIIPCFIISAHSFISPFLIPFPHAFHVSDIHFVSCPPPLIPVLNPFPCSPFHSTSHRIPLILFLFPLLFPTLCSFPMTLLCSLQYLYVQNFMYVSSVWNRHRMSLLNSPLSIPNLPNLPNLHPSKLRTREHWVAKHQSLSHVLVKPCHQPSSSAAPESLRLPCSVSVCPQLLQSLTVAHTTANSVFILLPLSLTNFSQLCPPTILMRLVLHLDPHIQLLMQALKSHSCQMSPPVVIPHHLMNPNIWLCPNRRSSLAHSNQHTAINWPFIVQSHFSAIWKSPPASQTHMEWQWPGRSHGHNSSPWPGQTTCSHLESSKEVQPSIASLLDSWAECQVNPHACYFLTLTIFHSEQFISHKSIMMELMITLMSDVIDMPGPIQYQISKGLKVCYHCWIGSHWQTLQTNIRKYTQSLLLSPMLTAYRGNIASTVIISLCILVT